MTKKMASVWHIKLEYPDQLVPTHEFNYAVHDPKDILKVALQLYTLGGHEFLECFLAPVLWFTTPPDEWSFARFKHGVRVTQKELPIVEEICEPVRPGPDFVLVGVECHRCEDGCDA
jgi:hypothetical protein